MKRVVFLLIVMAVVNAVKAQETSVQGKWTFVRIYDEKKNELLLDNKEESFKKAFAQAKAADSDFTEQDSMMVTMAYRMLQELFGQATFEFKKDGTYEFITQMELGGKKKAPETGTYNIDTSSSIITTESKGRKTSYQYQIREGQLYLTMKRGPSGGELVLVLSK